MPRVWLVGVRQRTNEACADVTPRTLHEVSARAELESILVNAQKGSKGLKQAHFLSLEMRQCTWKI